MSGRFYDRTFEPPPGTVLTPVQARELATQIECDERQQDGDGRDVVYIGSGETGVLVQTLRRFADLEERQASTPSERAVIFAGRNIVNQVLDAAQAEYEAQLVGLQPSFVYHRQAINDRCDEVAYRVITALLAGADSSSATVLADASTCQHENFSARVAVGRLTDESGLLTGFMADITVACVACSTPFVFLGVPMGVSLDQPCVAIDGTELRAPVAPSFAWVGPGKQLAARGFKVTIGNGGKSDA